VGFMTPAGGPPPRGGGCSCPHSGILCALAVVEVVREGEEMVVRDGEVCTASVVSVTPLRHCKGGAGAAEKKREQERGRERERYWQRGVVGRPERSGTHWSYWRVIENSTAARTHLEVLEGRMLAADGFDGALLLGITLTSPHCHLTITR